jgi:tetratricopeptide (TPR) repeat protein
MPAHETPPAQPPHRVAVSPLAAAQALFADAVQAHQRGDLAAAERLYRAALREAPDRPSIVANLATVLFQLGHFEASRAVCADALARLPLEAALWVRLGNAQSRLQQAEDALHSYRRALDLDGKHIEALTNAAHLLEAGGRTADALALLDRALAIAPDHVEALNNRGNVLCDLDRFEEALADYRRARALAPQDPLSCWNEALCRLHTGDFAGGWALYHHGWAAQQRGQPLCLPQPQWDGREQAVTLLVWGEQGIGDQILFSTLLDDLRRRVQQLVVALDERLLPLYRRAFPGLRLISLGEAPACRAATRQIAIGDLGPHLRAAAGAFRPPPGGFLRADPGRVAALRDRLGGGLQALCGLSWSSSNPRLGRFKSLGDADLSPLAAVPGVRWIDLQYGDTGGERRRMRKRWGLELAHVEDIDNFHDIDGFAALVAACDQVVSVSNTTVHVAGALGVPVQVMLPRPAGRIWYWHHGREDSPWYASCRLWRQHDPGDWRPVIEAVAGRLRAAFDARPVT